MNSFILENCDSCMDSLGSSMIILLEEFNISTGQNIKDTRKIDILMSDDRGWKLSILFICLRRSSSRCYTQFWDYQLNIFIIGFDFSNNSSMLYVNNSYVNFNFPRYNRCKSIVTLLVRILVNIQKYDPTVFQITISR